ncbi:MAG: ADP-ribosylglycohydrolase family protein [Rhodocyclales bacterium]|nr:ADP-ribosylglycohydrolase family protein [Rhodocyclales bacterium]
MNMTPGIRAIEGCLLGCAVGDSIGLPYEGLSTRRVRRFARLPLRHRFAFGKGMVSDDTDHSVFVAQALIRGNAEPAAFRRALAWRLRLWLLCLPAGIGWATLRSILRMWLGLRNSGVWSAGNGPAMRSGIIGAAVHSDPQRRRALVEASTRLTHIDPKALAGALAVAEVTARLASGTWTEQPATAELTALLHGISPDPDWQACVGTIAEACASPDPIGAAHAAFAGPGGVSGYVLHSVPFALVAWHHHFGDFRATIEAVVLAGGDVDTVAAMAGAMAGAVTGPSGIPSDWIDDIADWPHGVAYVRKLARRIVDDSVSVATHFSPALLPRGVVFTALVLAHGFRRLAPPYR